MLGSGRCHAYGDGSASAGSNERDVSGYTERMRVNRV
jgi:hypothetical protein